MHVRYEITWSVGKANERTHGFKHMLVEELYKQVHKSTCGQMCVYIGAIFFLKNTRRC